jgi:RND family efflux transporter MFP subunit
MMAWTRRFLLLTAVVVAFAETSLAHAETVTGEGVIQSDEKVAIKSPVVGTIRRLLVREGTILRKGEAVAEIDNDVQRAAVDTARAEVRRAEAAVAEALVTVESTTREYGRNSTVPDLITEKELALSRDAMLSAQASLRTRQEELLKAQNQLELAEQNLKLSIISAPFDGIVVRLYLREGDTPKTSETVLVDFLSVEKLYVEVALPLPYFRRVVAAMPARLVIESDTAAIRTTTTGTVDFVYPEADPVTRMFRVKISVVPDRGRVRPGLFASVQIDLSRPAR